MEERIDEWDMALVANSESVLFSQHDVLLDNEASINVFRSKELLKGIRKARKNVLLGGIQRGATGLRVTQEGDFNDVGTSSFHEWVASPRESFLGRKADGKRDFRCAFGDYVQCTVPETDNSMKSQTEDGVVMLVG